MKLFILLVLLICCVFDDNVLAKRKTRVNNEAQKQNEARPIQTGPITVDKSGIIALKINAKPGAKNNKITDISPDGIGVQIKALPVEGKANKELIQFFSKLLDLRKSSISLDRGSKSKRKTLTINEPSIKIEDITKKLNQHFKNRKNNFHVI